MTPEELKEDIAVEIENIETVLQELSNLYADVEGRAVMVRETTAASAFLAQFYSGIENILKRICRFYGVGVPSGEMWHVDLFKGFCDPPSPPLPMLFDSSLQSQLAPYRKFRHVVHHSYGFQLQWDRLAEGIAKSDDVFVKFRTAIDDFLVTLDS